MAGPKLSTSVDSNGVTHYYNTPTGYTSPVEISKLSYDTALPYAQTATPTNISEYNSALIAQKQKNKFLAQGGAISNPDAVRNQQISNAEQEARRTEQRAVNNREALNRIEHAPSPEKSTAKLGTNILNKYRSFNYNFTLAALTHEQFNNFKTYEATSLNDLKYIVLSSKGKPVPEQNNVVQDSENTILNSPTSSDIVALQNAEQGLRKLQTDAIASGNTSLAEVYKEAINQNVIDRSRAQGAVMQSIEKQTGKTTESVDIKSIISDYNKNSSGRFDMFIDDVELKALISNNKQTTTTIGYEFNFTVIEPYSSFGFFEALQASALAAGYYSYLDCNYVLAIDFVGYPDDKELSDPIPVVDHIVNKPAIRFFPITIFDVQTTITEQGTKYICKSIPGSYGAISEEENAKTSTAPKGTTVKEQLTDLMHMMNESSRISAEKIGNPNNWDKYEVQFPFIASNGNVFEDTDNEIADATFDPQFDTSGMKPQDIEKLDVSDPRRQSLSLFEASTPTKSKIEAIIFKSTYITDLITASYTGKGIDKKVNNARQAQMFRVVLKKTVHPEINLVTRRHAVTWTYQIIPTRTSYHRVPGQDANITSISDIAPLALRSYNYIYTGLNTDVLDFKINLNFAYYAGISPTMGSDGVPVTKEGAAANDGNRPIVKPGTIPAVAGLRDIPYSPWRSPPITVEEKPGGVVTATAPTRGDPTLSQVNILYNNLMDSPVALVNGEITILGDPYFLMSGGSSNHILSNSVQGDYAGNGEASALAGDVYVQLNFYNPTDIGANGQIDKELTGFSGIFHITGVNSIFRNGVFTQVLQYIRVPTPIDMKAQSGSKVGLGSTTAPLNAKVTDSSPAQAHPPLASDGVVLTPTANANKPPQPPADKAALYQGFTAGGNPISKESIANLAAGLKNPFAQVQAAVTDLQATVNSAVQSAENQITGAVRSAENQVTGAISKNVAAVTTPLSNIIRRG